MEIREIAKVCHEVNRAYCEAIGDMSQSAWDDAPDWQISSAIDGVKNIMMNSGSKPSDSHMNWMREKEENGWIYGEKKDEKKKTHPCMVPYEDLPVEQKAKDHIFMAIVKNLM